MIFTQSKKIIFSIVLVLVSVFLLGFFLEVSAIFLGDGKRVSLSKTQNNVYAMDLRRYALKVTELDAPKLYKDLVYLPKVKAHKTSDFYSFNQWGYKIHKKSFVGTHVSVAEETKKEIFHARYSFDQYGHRDTLGRPLKPMSHVLMVGCSFTFGEGLEDIETLSSQLQKLDQNSAYYNFGRMGGSVVDVIISQDDIKDWEGVEPKKGVVLFNFSSRDHMPRFLGTVKNIGTWNAAGAYLEVDKDRYKFAGFYIKNQFYRARVSQLLAKSKFLDIIGFDWPRVNAEAYESYVKAIRQVQSTYQGLYSKNNKLIVYFRPGETESAEIIPFLEKNKILYLDYSQLKLSHYAETDLEIPQDGHPSAEYNRLLAKQLYNDLSKNCIYEGRGHCSRAQIQNER